MCEMESDMATYGYARVSTDGQSLTAQIAELKAAKSEKIFQQKISGVRSDRKQLSRIMANRALWLCHDVDRRQKLKGWARTR